MIGNGNSNSKQAGYQPINKFGINLDIDTVSGNQTIWAHGGVFPFLDNGIAMDIVSTSTDDASAGTGAQSIKLTFYKTDNTEVIQIVPTNGTIRVEVADDIKICTRIELEDTGAGNTNAGEINLIDRATGIIVYQSVEIGEGQTLSAVQICPKNKKGFVRKHSSAYAKDQSPSGSADLRFYLRKNNGTVLTKHAVVISTIKPFDEIKYGIGGIEMEAGDIVFWECLVVTANDTPIEARFDVEFFNV